MTEKQYIRIFQTITKCIFTVLTGHAAGFLARTCSLLNGSVSSIAAYRQIPLCMEYLAAGILLYVLFAAASALALREYST